MGTLFVFKTINPLSLTCKDSHLNSFDIFTTLKKYAELDKHYLFFIKNTTSRIEPEMHVVQIRKTKKSSIVENQLIELLNSTQSRTTYMVFNYIHLHLYMLFISTLYFCQLHLKAIKCSQK